ncbi:MAG: hypothetical protein QOH97_5434 [Actinoplanes sp.]|jgi:hypothetical protein|nr:hypothetical protein [Actinoplanes sp.]
MAEQQQPPPRKRAAVGQGAPIVVHPPRTAPLSEQDRQQAVTALAALIAEWWAIHGEDPPTPDPAM